MTMTTPVEVVTLTDLGLPHARDAGQAVAPHGIDRWLVHHTTGRALGSPDPDEWVRRIWGFHVKHNGWDSIGYHFLIDPHSGRIYQGRPIGRSGAHAGDADLNRVALGVAVLGDYRTGYDPLTDQLMHGAQYLNQRVTAQLGHTLDVEGHRDVSQTACPGDELYAWAVERRGILEPPPRKRRRVEVAVIANNDVDRELARVASATYRFALVHTVEPGYYFVGQERVDIVHGIIVGAAGNEPHPDLESATLLVGRTRTETAALVGNLIAENPPGTEERRGDPFA